MTGNKSLQKPAHIERANKASDIVNESIVFSQLPSSWHPYIRLARLDRPIGTWLLLIPCWQGLALAFASSQSSLDWQLIYFAILFALGAVLMRGAGCALNDIADRNIDGKIARTALRPIPAGDITVREAIVFMMLLMFGGALVLIQFNLPTIIVGLASLPFAAIYPFMKRFTWWPQLFLGIAFNWGILVGWTAIVEQLSWPPIILYLAGVMWTLGYDTIYAHQDKEDDALVGVKSTARLFQAKSKYWISAFYVLSILGTVAAGFLAGLSALLILFLTPFAYHLIRQSLKTNFNEPAECLLAFKSNRNAGFLMLVGIILTKLFQA